MTTLLGSCHLEAKHQGPSVPGCPGCLPPHMLRAWGRLALPRCPGERCLLAAIFMFRQPRPHGLADIVSPCRSPLQNLLFLQYRLHWKSDGLTLTPDTHIPSLLQPACVSVTSLAKSTHSPAGSFSACQATGGQSPQR